MGGISLSLPDSSDIAQQRLMENVLANIPEAVAVVRGTQAIYVNAAFTRIFGKEPEARVARAKEEAPE